MNDTELRSALELAMSVGAVVSGRLQQFNEIVILRGAHAAGEGWSEGETCYEIRTSEENRMGDHGMGRTIEEALNIFLKRSRSGAAAKLKQFTAELEHGTEMVRRLEARLARIDEMIIATNRDI